MFVAVHLTHPNFSHNTLLNIDSEMEFIGVIKDIFDQENEDIKLLQEWYIDAETEEVSQTLLRALESIL